MTWAPGGNLPPMLAAARVLVQRGHEVAVLGSGPTRGAARELGLPVAAFGRAPEPDTGIAFEAQAERVAATLAGAEIALDTHEAIERARPDLVVVDCMAPAALAAAEVAGAPAASVVHFLYGPARRRMLDDGHGWTTDLRTLATTRRTLGLPPLEGALDAWERVALVLVSAPRWLDVEAVWPPHLVHAGPLGVRVRPAPPSGRGAGDQPRVLLSFSTTVMDGQPDRIERLCGAVAALDVQATLTLGPAVAPGAVRVAAGVEVLRVGDHDRMMPASAAVICHGGLGTVLRALTHGVPLLVVPLARDQALNAGRVEALGAGLALPADAPAQRMRAAVAALLHDPSFRAAALAAAERIAAADPDRTAAAALERAARGHGS